MGAKCPKCGSIKTMSYAKSPDEMHCKDCAHRWKPRLKGAKHVVIDDGVYGIRTLYVRPGYKVEKQIIGPAKIIRK